MKNRWNRIMEDINNGVDEAVLKKRYWIDGDTVAVYRKYAKKCRFNECGEYVDRCISAETISAMASFNQIADLVEIF